ncbi:MAG: diaminopropionate ammonia-lyase [Flavobacteriaceae bacterium]|nr:diaminopropionate ammonia-lyase [Flavobacteriaceae bacterium]|tara:strand:- start:3397 stop:4581 length:1185 start_codon:yes stop_codon:yes gene_type:complete
MLTEHFFNRNKLKTPYPKELKKIISLKDSELAFEEINKWKGYNSTPLHFLDEIASELGINEIYYKDESPRFDLKSFKALGGTYGVLMFIQNSLKKEIGDIVSTKDIYSGKYSKIVSKYTVTTATDGNHGRSVAFGAKLFGCKCKIYIHAEVSLGRKEAMEELGAKVIRVSGNYDESVHICKNEAKSNGWYIISDTSYKGYTEYPRYIMAGYTVMIKEIINQLKDKPLPTHIFLQAGVGSFPGAICGYFWERFHEHDIKIIIVESDLAGCLIKSAQTGKMSSVDIKKETIMAGLSCGEPSLLGWEILKSGADYFVTINDDLVPKTMKLLLDNYNIEAGESSVAGLVALMDINNDQNLKNKMGINEQSVILLFGTEGATDLKLYQSIIQNNKLGII